MIIKEIRKKLLSPDQEKKGLGIEELKKLLSDRKTRKLLIIETISADVAIVLTSILAQRNENLQRSILTCWEILSEDEYFYKNNVATSVIMKILETGILIAANQIKEQSILLAMAHTLALLFCRAKKFKVFLKFTKFFDQSLLFINYLKIKNSTDEIKITVVGNLFFSILIFVDSTTISLDNLQIIQELYEDIIKVISTISTVLKQKNKIESFKIIFTTVLNICSTGVNFINEDERSLNSDSEDSPTINCNKRLEIFKNIFNISCKKILDIVIPNFKKFDEQNCEFEDNLKHFITFLNGLYEQDYNTDYIKKISFELSIQGYLKYFLQKIQNSKLINLRQSICKCLALILMNLAHDNLSIEQWPGDLRGFCKFIYDGLMFYAKSGELKSNSPCTDALLFCSYFHYHATNDTKVIEIIGQIPLTERILHLSVENLPQVSIVQIIWFLISEWMLKSNTVDSDKCLPDALTHLIEILLKVGVEKCYMCYPALVVTVLQNPIFPREIRHQVVKLWLKTDGDVYTLVDVNHRDVVVDSLIYALKTGCKDVVIRASKDLIEIAKNTNPMKFDFMLNIWEQISDNLTTYKKENEHNLEGLLKLANELMTTDLSVIFAMQFIVKFITFFSKNIDIKLKIKILLIKLTNKMFSIVSTANDSIVVPSKIMDKNILNEIRNQAFKNTNNDLSIACLKCLSNIFIIIIPFSKKLSQLLLITSTDLIDILSKDIQVSIEVMMLLNTLLLSYKNYSDCVIIDFGQNNIKKDIYQIYDSLIEIHNKVVSIEWKLTFNCLTNFLIFVKLNYPIAMSDCCDNVSIHLTIIRTINNCYIHTEFFKFINIWLEQGLQSHCSFIDGTFELNRIKINFQNNLLYESTFEKALKQLKIYIEKINVSHEISLVLLENIKFKISLLV